MFQTEIDSKHFATSRKFIDFDMQRDVPSTFSVLDESTALYDRGERAAFYAEEAVRVSEIGDRVVFDLSTLTLEWNPTEGFF